MFIRLIVRLVVHVLVCCVVCLFAFLFGWFVGWLVSWVVGWLYGWCLCLVGLLFGRFVGCLFARACVFVCFRAHAVVWSVVFCFSWLCFCCRLVMFVCAVGCSVAACLWLRFCVCVRSCVLARVIANRCVLVCLIVLSSVCFCVCSFVCLCVCVFGCLCSCLFGCLLGCLLLVVVLFACLCVCVGCAFGWVIVCVFVGLVRFVGCVFIWFDFGSFVCVFVVLLLCVWFVSYGWLFVRLVLLVFVIVCGSCLFVCFLLFVGRCVCVWSLVGWLDGW